MQANSSRPSSLAHQTCLDGLNPSGRQSLDPIRDFYNIKKEKRKNYKIKSSFKKMGVFISNSQVYITHCLALK